MVISIGHDLIRLLFCFKMNALVLKVPKSYNPKLFFIHPIILKCKVLSPNNPIFLPPIPNNPKTLNRPLYCEQLKYAISPQYLYGTQIFQNVMVINFSKVKGTHPTQAYPEDI